MGVCAPNNNQQHAAGGRVVYIRCRRASGCQHSSPRGTCHTRAQAWARPWQQQHHSRLQRRSCSRSCQQRAHTWRTPCRTGGWQWALEQGTAGGGRGHVRRTTVWDMHTHAHGILTKVTITDLSEGWKVNVVGHDGTACIAVCRGAVSDVAKDVIDLSAAGAGRGGREDAELGIEDHLAHSRGVACAIRVWSEVVVQKGRGRGR